MDNQRLDFARGARVVAADEEVGSLAHAITDPDTRDVLGIVVDDGREWIVPLVAVRSARRDLVELARPWATVRAERFDRADFDRIEHFAVHRRIDRLELRAEELVVHKQRQPVGVVEVGTRVVSERQVTEVPVLREELVVERRAVEPRPAEAEIGQPRVLTVPLRAERVTLERVPIVREEVAIARRTVEDTQVVVETARREEAVVEARPVGAAESVEGVER
jgi:uncharacterized protein (TIGR02271 family)